MVSRPGSRSMNILSRICLRKFVIGGPRLNEYSRSRILEIRIQITSKHIWLWISKGFVAGIVEQKQLGVNGLRFARPLELLIQLVRNGKSALVKHRAENLYSRTFQLFLYAANHLAPGLIRLDNQHDAVGELPHKRRFRLPAEGRRADEDVIKRLA